MTDLVTVIVPVYNTEKQIKSCIKSITSQTYKNLEIILVDDGSTDNSLKLCHEAAKEDERIIVMHQENAGQSSARNRAIDSAKGKYLAFCDSDDTMMPEMIEKLMIASKNNNAEIVMCNATKKIKEENKTARIFLENVLMDKFGEQLWKFLFDVKLWDGIRLPVGRFVEDAYVLPKLIKKAEKIAIIDEILYDYNFANPDSSSNLKIYSAKNSIDRAMLFIDRYYDVQKGNYSKNVLETVSRKAAHFAVSSLGKNIDESKYQNDILYIKSFLKSERNLLLKNPQLNFSHKAALIFASGLPNLYNKIMRKIIK